MISISDTKRFKMKGLYKEIGVGLVSLPLILGGCAKQEQPFKTEKWKYEYNIKYPSPFHSPGDKLREAYFSEIKKKYAIGTIEGKIIDVDEDAFSSGYVGFFSAAGTDFHFEFIRIKDKEGKERKLLIPQPFNYKIGDSIKENYIPLKKDISFKQITDRWDKMFRATQIGRLDNIEGIIIKDMGFCEIYLNRRRRRPDIWNKLEEEGQSVNNGPNMRYVLLKKSKIE